MIAGCVHPTLIAQRAIGTVEQTISAGDAHYILVSMRKIVGLC